MPTCNPPKAEPDPRQALAHSILLAYIASPNYQFESAEQLAQSAYAAADALLAGG